ncbi:hypothetical protein BsWGS_21851 [Bradybaena similaris]
MAEQDPWAPFEGKYKIHEESREYGRFITANMSQPILDAGFEKSREQVLDLCLALAGQIEFEGEETEMIIPSPHVSEGIPVTVYKPASRPDVPAILIHFHGGALIFCNRKTHETVAKIIARDSGAIVVHVEYRLLPNPDAPCAPFDDAEVVTRWVLENKVVVGGKPQSKVGVGGDSAGGQLAISVTNEVTGLDFQILVYPVADTALKQDTVKEFKHLLGLNEDSVLFMQETAFKPIPNYLTNPKVNGMARTNTASSPPALIILAELDPLRGCGIDYANKLRAAGVKVQLEIIEGVLHGFLLYIQCFRTTSSQAFDRIAKFVKQFQ